MLLERLRTRFFGRGAGPKRQGVLSRHRGRPLMCIAHSDRPTELENCAASYLETRYSDPGRLPPAQPFNELRPLSELSRYHGEITVYDLGDGAVPSPSLVCRLRPEGYKPQHSIWYDGHLWILGVDRIEVFDPDLRLVGSIRDPWLAGGHTITPAPEHRLLVSCAASDSVLIVDARSRRLLDALRLPESLYGHNYPLSRTDSVVEHFIPNDYQLTHVNCAWPWRGGILTSALIPGAIGWFDPAGSYRELLRGFVGCHGVRVRGDTGEIYFADSCRGALIFLDEKFEINRRIETGSKWLHDAVQISGNIFACAVTDRNEVTFIDVANGEALGALSCEGFGGGPQFVSFGS